MRPFVRLWGIIVDSHAEWPRIAREPSDTVGLALRYVAPLAAVPVLAAFAGSTLIGMVAPDGATVRTPVFGGLLAAAFGYVANFTAVFVIAVIADMLAPRFGGERNFASAFKLAAYSFTPVWLAGIFLLVPGLRFLYLLGGYGAYIAWTGLMPLMKAPRENTLPYAAIISACALAIVVLANMAQRLLFGSADGT